MSQSKVYFSNFRVQGPDSLLQKLARLIRAAGIEEIDFERKLTAIKIHFGEPGNMAYLRPNWAKTVADVVKSLGGRPFLTDCNTLYVGRRKDALEHLEAAYENGFSPFSTGCHALIADGLKGNDEVLVPVDGDYVSEAKIGRAIMDADVFISLSHFKGHSNTGFGGALKNIGMGCGSRRGKMEMHNSGKPFAHHSCIGCRKCLKRCAHQGIDFVDNKAVINENNCVGCGRCIAVCPVDAIRVRWDEANDILNCKMAEYSLAVLKDRPNFHISLVLDISPDCDCNSYNDAPVVPNVGMFASFDPVALDMACIDAVNKQPTLPGSALDEKYQQQGCGCNDAACHHGHDHSHDQDHMTFFHPDTNWRSLLAHAQKIGLGNPDYQLIELDK